MIRHHKNPEIKISEQIFIKNIYFFQCRLRLRICWEAQRWLNLFALPPRQHSFVTTALENPQIQNTKWEIQKIQFLMETFWWKIGGKYSVEHIQWKLVGGNYFDLAGGEGGGDGQAYILIDTNENANTCLFISRNFSSPWIEKLIHIDIEYICQMSKFGNVSWNDKHIC